MSSTMEHGNFESVSYILGLILVLASSGCQVLTYFLSLASHTVEKWPQPSLRTMV